MTLRERLLSQVVYDASDCWLYIGGQNTQGYGYILDDNKRQWRAHILSYELHKEKVPEGLLVLHTCDNPSCINPEHLFIGTYQDNVDDMRRKGRDSYGENKGEKNGQAVLTEEAVWEIRRLLNEGHYTQNQIGAMYGVTRGAIKCIKLGITWKHLKEVQ